MPERKIVLAVDDMAENLTLVRSMLEGYFDIRLAKSAKQALTLLQNTQVDLILLDIEMPGMSGFEFLRRLGEGKTPNTETPVIIVTSHAAPDFINEAINWGARDYLVKPIKEEVLLKKVGAIIELPETKTLPHPLEDKLKNLLSATNSANSAYAEAYYKELIILAENENSINRHFVEDIGKIVKALEYEKASAKIKEFLVYLSLKKK